MKDELWECSVKFVREQRLEVGDLVRALPKKDLVLDHMEYFKAGDEGMVQGFTHAGMASEHAKIAWARTGQVSSVPIGDWMACFHLLMKQAQALTKGSFARIHGLQGAKHLNGALVTCEQWDEQKGRWTVRLQTGEEKSLKSENLMFGKGIENPRAEDNCDNQEQLGIGDVVQVLAGNRLVGFYEAGDEGTIQDFYLGDDGEERVRVVWAQSGKTASIIKKTGLSAVRLVRKQVLEVGDVVEALPGMELVREDREYYKSGDQATVIEFRAEGTTPNARVLWTRTGVVSDLPQATWMSFVRVVQKGGGIAKSSGSSAKNSAAGYVSGQAPKVAAAVRKPLKVGQRARVEGLQGAAHRNGATVECKKWDETKGRWLVHIVTEECLVKPLEMSVKPINLVAM